MQKDTNRNLNVKKSEINLHNECLNVNNSFWKFRGDAAKVVDVQTYECFIYFLEYFNKDVKVLAKKTQCKCRKQIKNIFPKIPGYIIFRQYQK